MELKPNILVINQKLCQPELYYKVLSSATTPLITICIGLAFFMKNARTDTRAQQAKYRPNRRRKREKSIGGKNQLAQQIERCKSTAQNQSPFPSPTGAYAAQKCGK